MPEVMFLQPLPVLALTEHLLQHCTYMFLFSESMLTTTQPRSYYYLCDQKGNQGSSLVV